MKQKVKLVMATLFLLMTMTVYLFAAEAATCKDCGSEDNCLGSNGFTTSGYLECYIMYDSFTGRIICQPIIWCYRES